MLRKRKDQKTKDEIKTCILKANELGCKILIPIA